MPIDNVTYTFFKSDFYSIALQVMDTKTKKQTTIGLGNKSYTYAEIQKLLEQAYARIGVSPEAKPKRTRKKASTE